MTRARQALIVSGVANKRDGAAAQAVDEGDVPDVDGSASWYTLLATAGAATPAPVEAAAGAGGADHAASQAVAYHDFRVPLTVTVRIGAPSSVSPMRRTPPTRSLTRAPSRKANCCMPSWSG